MDNGRRLSLQLVVSSQLKILQAKQMGNSKDRAEKYRACIRIGGKTDGDNELSFYGVRVTSIENIPSFDRCMENNGKHFLCIPRILVENICKHSEEKNENKLYVKLVISET